MTIQPTLRDKFFGCIAGVHIGSAMAAPVEGWPWRRNARTCVRANV